MSDQFKLQQCKHISKVQTISELSQDDLCTATSIFDINKAELCFTTSLRLQSVTNRNRSVGGDYGRKFSDRPYIVLAIVIIRAGPPTICSPAPWAIRERNVCFEIGLSHAITQLVSVNNPGSYIYNIN